MIRKSTVFLSATSGILLCLPWVFTYLGWTLFVAFVPLLVAEEQLITKKSKESIHSFFLLSFPAFLIWNLFSTWWIGYVSVVGMLLIVFVNSLLMTFIWCLRHLIRLQLGTVSSYFSLLAFWLTFEYLHHNWSMQWPWLTLGNGLAGLVEIIQWYEFTGVLGGSLWILFVNIFTFLVIRSVSAKAFVHSVKLTGCTIAFIIIPIGLSLFRYSSYQESGSKLDVLVLQPNIDPYTEKFSGISNEKQVEKLVLLTASVNIDSVDIIVAPETALPEMWEDSVADKHPTIQSLSEIFRRNPEVSIIAGAMTNRKFRIGEPISATARQSADGGFYFDVFNSALHIDSTLEIQLRHKSILVSGVESMPFQKYFSFLKKYSLQIGGISGSLGVAEAPEVFTTKNNLKIGPVICFESAFGEHCSKLVKKGANLLVVITNDGWWKGSTGSWQHFSYSRLRAIETRRSIARSANTGISGFINQRGDVLKKTKSNSMVALPSSVRLNDRITFYAMNGDWIGKISGVLTALILLFAFWNRLKKNISR